MQDAIDVRPRFMDRAVNGEARRVNRKRRLTDFLTVQIDLDETTGRDFLEQHAIGVDQKVFVRTRHGCGNVG